MKQIECSCGAVFRSDNEEELVDIMRLHASRTHIRNILIADARKLVQEESEMWIRQGRKQ